ncbi:ABC transporter ATP-binding protein [Portibacter marinus]|uniref:ABC transporter ATP-binding protein n=1 Tax=Portibacter marinus TaxID=2898660 RepID=UPI001F30A5E4|nr:ABC transporter ATP-binding protein [Portibacter marinus]
MQLISNPEIAENSEFFLLLTNFLNIDDFRELLLWVGFGILAIIGVKNAIGLLSTWLKFKYSWDTCHTLSLRLLRSFLNKPYSFYLNSNTSDAKTYVIAETNSISVGVLVPLIEFFSRCLSAIIILALLLYVDIKISLMMFTIIGGAYLIIFYSRRKFLSTVGEHRLEMNTLRFRSITELFNGIKTILAYHKQALFYKRFEYGSREFCNVQPKYNFIISSPKYILEFISFTAIIAVTIYLFLTEGDLQSVLPKLSLYALAGYRLIPAFQNAFTAISKYKHNLPALDRMYEDLKMGKHLDGKMLKITSEVLPFDNKIEFKNVRFKYENADHDVIEDLSFSINKGERVAFIGSTGSGKTTIIDLLVGILMPQSGQICVDGKVLVHELIDLWQNNISYVPQETFLFDDNIQNNIALQIDETINKEKLVQAAKVAEIFDFINSQEQQFNTEIGENGVRLSGGQRQRLGLARAIYRNPNLLILDEATSSLDRLTEQSVIKSLENLPKDLTIISIAHRLSTVKHVDKIYILDQGKIVAHGSYEELIKSNKAFKKLVEIS